MSVLAMLGGGPREADRDLGQPDRGSFPAPPAASDRPEPPRLRFGPYELDPAAGLLTRDGAVVKLQPQPFKVLALLVRRAGQVVSRDEIRREVWGEDTFVNFEQGLAYCLNQVRNALGEQAQDARYVQTLPRRGYRFVAPVTVAGSAAALPETGTAAHGPGRHWKPALTLVAIGLAVAALVSLRTERTPPAQAARAVVVVLPFEDLGPEAAAEHLGDGMTEDVITAIGRARPDRIAVIARSSAMRYKGARPALDALGRELGVSHVLEGSVRRDGARVRVTARLVRASDGAQVWARTHDRDVRDVLALQAQVAADVATLVGGTLSGTGARARAMDPDVYRLLAQGRHYLHQRTEAGYRNALRAYEDAARRDPESASAQAGLAHAWIGLAERSGATPAEAFDRARAAAERALDLDPTLPEAHVVRGAVAAIHEYDWAAAEASYRRAIALNPSDATAHHWYSLLLEILGRPDEALQEARAAFAGDPVSPSASHNLSGFLLMAGHAQEALAQADATLALEPGHLNAHLNRGQALLRLGRPDEALRAFEEVAGRRPESRPRSVALQAIALRALGRGAEAERRLAAVTGDAAWRDGTYDHYARAVVLHHLGRTDEAMAELGRSADAHESVLRFALVDDVLEGLRGDPRLAAIAQRLGLKPASR